MAVFVGPLRGSALAAPPINAKKPSGVAYLPGDWLGRNGFGSLLAGVLGFVMADGSVRFLSENMALGLYRVLAMLTGSEIVGAF